MPVRSIRYTALCLMLALAVQTTVTGGVCFMLSKADTLSGTAVVATLDVCGHANHTALQNGADAPYILSWPDVSFQPSTTSYPDIPASGHTSVFPSGPKEPPEA